MLSLALLSLSAYGGDKTVDDFVVSVTISPPHLTFPMVELTGEYKAAPKVGAAVIGAIGQVSDYPAYEVGAQGRYYALGDFRSGLEVGAELLYLSIDVDQEGVEASGAGLAIGPFIGGKHIADFGLTVDGQIGVQHLSGSAQATDGETSASDEFSGWVPLLNLNIGWSF